MSRTLITALVASRRHQDSRKPVQLKHAPLPTTRGAGFTSLSLPMALCSGNVSLLYDRVSTEGGGGSGLSPPGRSRVDEGKRRWANCALNSDLRTKLTEILSDLNCQLTRRMQALWVKSWGGFITREEKEEAQKKGESLEKD